MKKGDCEFTSLTNATHISVLDIANLYKKMVGRTDKTNLRALFDKTDFNDVKELNCSFLMGYLINI